MSSSEYPINSNHPPTPVFLVQVPFCTSHGDVVDTHGLPGFDFAKGESVQVLKVNAIGQVQITLGFKT